MRIHIIHNPKAGKLLRNVGEELILALIHQGHRVSYYPTTGNMDAAKEAKKQCDLQEVDLILAAGGDGTLNEVTNGIMYSEKKLPIAPFAGGTSNDFCSYLKLPDNPQEYARYLTKKAKPHCIDIGKVGQRYFINVVACGMLSEVAHKTDSQLKSVLGSFAYYIEGLKEIITRGLYNNIEVQSKDFHYKGEFVVFLVSNSHTIGGFKNLAPDASINDGYLNVLLIKKAPFVNLLDIAMNLDKGAHVSNPYVDYFTTKDLCVITDSQMDVDGEHLFYQKSNIQVIAGELECYY